MLPFTTCVCGRQQWTVLQGRIKLVHSHSEDTHRRGGISFGQDDNNAIYVRMLGDVRLRVTSETEKANLHPQDRKLLERLLSTDKNSRLSSRFQSFNKHRRKRSVTENASRQLQSLLDQQYSQQAQELMSQLSVWNFDIFNLDVLTGGRSLTHVAIHLFKKYNLISTFKLDFIKLMQTFTLIENGYHGSNPYHNAVHAADVTQAMHCYLQEVQLRGWIPSFEIMTSLLAAMTHDLDHPGVNQAFLIATANHLADLYQNTSVLENHHWRCAVGVFYETGVFSHLDQDSWNQIIWQLRSLILATDITRQQEFLSRFKKYLDEDNLNYKNDLPDRIFLLQIALKCADISNPCREWSLSKQWSGRVCDEFFRQGDYERELELPVTPMCNRVTTTTARIQAGFMEYVVNPLFYAWRQFLPSKLSDVMLDNVAQNLKNWREVIEEEGEINKPTESDEEVLNQEKSDTVEEGRLPLNYIHITDDDSNSLCTDSRRGSCRSLSPVREILENGWDPEQRRHSMPPAYVKREITCVTIRRESVPMSQFLRRRSLPTAMLVQTSSLEKLSGKLSALAQRHNMANKSISMEELMSRPKISNLTTSYETSLLASGLSVVTDPLYSKSDPLYSNSHSSIVRFLSVPQNCPDPPHDPSHPKDSNTFPWPSNKCAQNCDQQSKHINDSDCIGKVNCINDPDCIGSLNLAGNSSVLPKTH
ncbi:high affinity cAMP-specific 3',5'-cyclic phosphodiesterase 7A-like isoform X2 [Saccostrea echinata]|uniref:high affinity cAMP-specific 3',5'-cyclic phosphodiesterase 7A-like isoform X2 n=1 Tax=Saccostrea echinata TaxID=191078 RepID=UPI002A816933|nr:high affinity cAMP-specific 3',5'-cyclic phosphodiesterase 7A-like isoform X2 [Saccostrea echinata]